MAFYVSPQGNDRWSGLLPAPNTDQSDGPFASLERARDAVRAAKQATGLPAGGVTVYLRQGDYILTDGLALDETDSGTETAPIVYRSFQEEEVRLLGGRPVDNFEPVTDPAALERLDETARPHVLQSDLRATGINDFGRLRRRPDRGVPGHLELFFNGQPMTLARWPNKGWTHIARGGGIAVSDGHQSGWTLSPLEDGFHYDGDRPKRWKSLKNIWVQGFWGYDWSNTYEEVDTIDTEKRLIKTRPPYGTYGYQANQRFRFLNILEELDSPGMYYVDTDVGILYFWPPEPVVGNEVLASVLETPIVSLQNAAHVTIRGFRLECTRGRAVVIEGGHDNLVAGCAIRNTGSDGVVVSGGANHGVQSCDITETGEGGIIISGGDHKTLAPCGHYVHNNHIWRFARWCKTYSLAIGLTGVGMRVSHNLMHDAPHTAILFSGNDNLFEFNEIHHVCLETGDAGGIYTGRDYTGRGNLLRYNFIHDMGGVGIGTNGMYFDDCVSGQTFFGNVLCNAPRAVFIGGGRDLVVRNNLFIDCDPSIEVDARGIDPNPIWQNMVNNYMKQLLDEVNHHEPPYSERYPELQALDAYYEKGEGIPPDNNVIERNISVGGTWLHIHWFATEEHVSVGRNLVGVDPRFVDAEQGDYRLEDDSPALDMGFEPIPFDRIGLVQDEYRPVV